MSLLLRLLSSLRGPAKPAAAPASPAAQVARVAPIVLDPARRNVLDVGGGPREYALPPHYADWRRLMLDVDANAKPDVLLDARSLATLPAAQFDAVYCSHNLEHYHEHEVAKVLAGFAHVLKAPDGFVEIRVPDLHAVAQAMVAQGRDLGDALYVSPAGPIRVVDVLYGYSRAIEQSGQDYYAHKTGFTRRALRGALEAAGFTRAYRLAPLGPFEIRTLALRAAPGGLHREMFGLEEGRETL